MSKSFILALALIFPLLLAGCSDKPEKPKVTQDDLEAAAMKQLEEKPENAGRSVRDQESQAPPADGTIGISPSSPTVADRLRITVPGSLDTNGAAISWRLNGAPLSGQFGMTLDLSGLDALKGDTVSAEMIVDGASYLSPETIVENAVPEIESLRLMPAEFRPGEKIYAVVKFSDADNDKVTINYEWYVNGTPAGNAKTLDKSIGRGDEFEVRVVVYDGQDYSMEEVLVQGVDNFPPMLEGHYKYTFDGTTYTYKAKATDPDGDEIRYSLTTGPDSMTINETTGVVTWQVPEDFIGTADFTIVAEDGSGGSSTLEQSFSLTQE